MEPLRAARVPLLDAVAGLVHGFEQRGGPAGEPREHARRRLQQALDGAGALLLLKQVHGDRVLEAPWEGRPEADAATASRPGLLLGIETADCLPVFIVDPRRRAVAAAHAGWRGTARAVTRAAVRSLVASGSRPSDLLAALGPSIGPCCYEVGDDVRQALGPAAGPFFMAGPGGRPHLDLKAANAAQLREEGLAGERMASVDECTRCLADRYHSYRREGTAAGRMINFVGFAS